VPRHTVESHLADQTLVAVLEDWRPRSVGFYLYYPSRRQMPAALQALVDTLKAELASRHAAPNALTSRLRARRAESSGRSGRISR